ncbi:tRNA(Ile)-lysidine synthetase [alpha proteobacterium U9-1i]|nr:tRNA(Ile)-lysidine synthetase [alpha proteobacterium U9-1i]
MPGVTSVSLDQAFIHRWKNAPLVLALSGGGDSTALLHLLADSGARFRAVVIDHALRDGSSKDANRAAMFAEARGVGAEIVTLTWTGNSARGQEASRRARYVALCDAARRSGAEAILTAHTADDQAETVLMRAGAGSGWRGLAGMAAESSAPVWPEGRGVRLLRPLLNTRRDDLRALLRARGAAWIEDPANTNPRFERVRVRAQLSELERSGFDSARLARTAGRLRTLADSLDAEARALIAQAAIIGQGEIKLARAAWRGAELVCQRALAVLLAAAAGAERLAEAEAVARLMPRLTEEGFRGATLGGAALVAANGDVVLKRDPGALLGRAGVAAIAPLHLPPRIETVWDGRLAVNANEAGWRVTIDDQARPIFERGQAVLSLAEAISGGVVEATWLTRAAIAHRLGPDFAMSPSISVG